MTGPKWVPAGWKVPRPDTITEAMECSQKGIYYDCPPKTHQATERVRCRYLHPVNGQKLVSPVVKLGKNWKKLRRWATLEEDQQSQLT